MLDAGRMCQQRSHTRTLFFVCFVLRVVPHRMKTNSNVLERNVRAYTKPRQLRLPMCAAVVMAKFRMVLCTRFRPRSHLCCAKNWQAALRVLVSLEREAAAKAAGAGGAESWRVWCRPGLSREDSDRARTTVYNIVMNVLSARRRCRTWFTPAGGADDDAILM